MAELESIYQLGLQIMGVLVRGFREFKNYRLWKSIWCIGLVFMAELEFIYRLGFLI